MTLKAFIFDMDGVIVDSEPLQVEAERWACDRFGIVVPEEKWATFKGRTNRSIFEEILRDHSDGLIPVEALISAKRGHYIEIAKEKMRLVNGSLQFIAYVREQIGRCALVTSSSGVVCRMVFERYSLEPFFDVVVVGDDVREGKPHPEPYLVATRKLGIDPREVCVLEDSDNGVRSAKDAGCHVIGLTTSFDARVLEASGAHNVVRSYDELYKVLDQLLEGN